MFGYLSIYATFYVSLLTYIHLSVTINGLSLYEFDKAIQYECEFGFPSFLISAPLKCLIWNGLIITWKVVFDKKAK